MTHNLHCKVALITAIDSEDGDLLAEFLLSQDYAVHGIQRSASTCYGQVRPPVRPGVTLHTGDLSDTNSLMRIIQDSQPDEIYSLSGFVQASSAELYLLENADVDALGTLRLLQSIRELGLDKKTRFFNASTADLKDLLMATSPLQTLPALSNSPRVVSNLYAYLITAHYRAAYGLFACNGVWFNPESPCVGERLVTQPIDQTLAQIAQGDDECLFVESFDTLRDWTAPRFVPELQWRMLQQEQACDSLLTSGTSQTVRQYMTAWAAEQGITLAFNGKGPNEYAVVLTANPNKTPALHPGQVIAGLLPNELGTKAHAAVGAGEWLSLS
jgi:GDPmannose 4,6-dehydratase